MRDYVVSKCKLICKQTYRPVLFMVADAASASQNLLIKIGKINGREQTSCRCDHFLQRPPVFSMTLCKPATVKRELRLILMKESRTPAVFSTYLGKKSVIIWSFTAASAIVKRTGLTTCCDNFPLRCKAVCYRASFW